MLVLGLAARDALRVRSTLVDSRAQLTAFAFGGDLTATVGAANAGLADADHLAHHSPWLGLLGPIPVIGDQVEGLRDVTSAAAEVGGVAERVATDIDVAAGTADDGPGRLALLDLAEVRLTELEAALAAVPPDHRFLLPPLSSARDDFDDEVAERLADLRDALGRFDAIRRVLTGPGRYLVLGGNNAEMSGSVGMPLTAGVLEIEGGELHLGPFEQTSDLLSPGGPPLDENLDRLYGRQGFSYDFRGTTATPNFPRIGPILADMSARVATGPVDGVFLIDTVAVGALIDATRPISVNGQTFTGSQAIFQLLVTNYQSFGDQSVRDQRVEVQGEYAQAVFDNLTDASTGITTVASTIAELARGRHFLAWARDDEIQSLWEEIDADGAVGPTALAVSVENMDGNKLDTFIQPHVEIDTVGLPNGETQADLTLEFTAPDIPGASPYLVGNAPEIHFTQIVLHLPEGSSAISVIEAPERIFSAEGTDTDSVVVTTLYGTPTGQTSRYHIRFKLPEGLDRLDIVPSARAQGTVYDVDGEVIGDLQPVSVALDPHDDAGRSVADVTAAVIAAVAALGAGLGAAATRRRLRAA